MRVINAMFGRKKGVIEKSFLDYCNIIIDMGCQLTVLTYQDSPMHDLLPANVEVKAITNFGQWDPVASWKLKKIIKELAPDVIVAHGNRASSLLSKSIIDVPVVSVCHNYNAKTISDYKKIITVTEDLRKSLIKKGVDDNIIYTVPTQVNMPEISEKRALLSGEVPVIGAIGKIVAKRGLKYFLRALALLKNRGIAFKAVIAGEGPEKDSLIALAISLNLTTEVDFVGEVENRKEFFSNIDVFCLPSLNEPFGIVILEAFTHGVAVVTTDTEGPIEIVNPYIDALVVGSGEDYSLADALEKLIMNQKFAERIANAGYEKVSSSYNADITAKKLRTTLDNIINEHSLIRKQIVPEFAMID